MQKDEITIKKIHKDVMNVLKKYRQEEQQQMCFLQEQLKIDLVYCDELNYNARVKKYLEDAKKITREHEKKLLEALGEQIN